MNQMRTAFAPIPLLLASIAFGVDPETPVRVGDEIPEPSRLQHLPPIYPEIARRASVRGIVFLEFTVNSRGKVADVRVLRGVPLLDQAAIDAVRQWRYEPLDVDGVATPFVVTVAIIIPSDWIPVSQLVFTLHDSSEFVRASAVTELGRFGPKAREALQTLQDLAAEDESQTVRRAATRALGLIGRR